ncbi:WYL domain-containing protein [Nocardia huaxiensis]|uniref:WYL domain-containing protein n=1 Tax=Nocardia huaxiensis TaxID=2755382 RepID=A0A7D6VF41_9NOCA|nr:WYL domain-containing protein [Nocardia huaxiensis]QLY28676.1 WYL domain-containing protein [Nocardia huaxiensis]
MPIASSTVTSRRLLALLSLLQVRRDWPGGVLARRLEVSERTVRRDIDRLRELGYPVRAVKGPDGGYRLEAGSELPPLLFDDEQAVALVVALRGVTAMGAGMEEAAERALATVRQVLPARLRQRVDAVEITAVAPGAAPRVDTRVLLALSEAVRSQEEVRFDYSPETGQAQDRSGQPRCVQPHHLVVRNGRWYLIGWVAEHGDWRVYRTDRMTLRIPNGPRFAARELPGGDIAAFLSARFKGSDSGDVWPCSGEAILDLPVQRVAPFVGDGIAEPCGPTRTRVLIGSWSWAALAATLARFDTEIEVIGPPQLHAAFTDLAARAGRAARTASVT